MSVKFSNNALSTIPAGLSSTAVTFTVATGQGSRFPILGSGDYFYATISSVAGVYEIVKCTARADDVFTVLRAQEGTAAIPFPPNSSVENRITAASISELVGSSVEGGTY
jgi:hypothetical protein